MLLIKALRRAPVNLLTRHTASSRLAPAARQIRTEAPHIRPPSHIFGINASLTTKAGAVAAPKPPPPGTAPDLNKLFLPYVHAHHSPGSRPSSTIYHAGSGRIAFLACLKISTLFIFAFFGFVVTPAYYQKEGLSPTVVRTAICAIVPLVFVAYITSPFVLFIHLRLPPSVQRSKELVRRYREMVVKTLPPQVELDITTMSLIGKPRVSTVILSELRPVNRRFGVVNVARDTAAENARRKWYMFRAVGDFSIRESPKSPWMWDSIWAQLAAKY
ncbi:hypothetical protein GGS21DRAFT_487418 [Xylaria nigripes]|nr:hypothetical protein GGS21DRAFT_487418 [Xylaria nigripes]